MTDMTYQDAIWILEHVEAHGIAKVAKDLAIEAMQKIAYRDEQIKRAVNGEWYRKINPNYSPLDGSSPYDYICPVCEFKADHPSNYCPACGCKMFMDEPFYRKEDQK